MYWSFNKFEGSDMSKARRILYVTLNSNFLFSKICLKWTPELIFSKRRNAKALAHLACQNVESMTTQMQGSLVQIYSLYHANIGIYKYVRNPKIFGKCPKIWQFGLATRIWTHFGRYLWFQCMYFKTNCLCSVKGHLPYKAILQKRLSSI